MDTSDNFRPDQAELGPNAPFAFAQQGGPQSPITPPRIKRDRFGNIILGNGLLGAAATKGFIWIPVCHGKPTGTPFPLYPGWVPLIYDDTNHKLSAYDGGAWKQTGAFT